jgi:hypothetical protein
MLTVEALEQALAAAGRLGFKVRMEWLGGEGGGACEIRGERWIFIDLATTAEEQLAVVLDALAREEAESVLPLPLQPSVVQLVRKRKTA